MAEATMAESALKVISREEAKALGLKRYFLGIEMPCKRGHVSERVVSSRACLKCSNESSKRYAESNRQKVLDRKKKERMKPGFLDKVNERRRALRKKDPELHKNKAREYYLQNKDKYRKSGLKYYYANRSRHLLLSRLYRIRNLSKILVKAARDRAKKKGLPFDLTVSDISIPETCPVLGIPISPGERGFHPNSPTIDRFIPELGYVRGNVSVISCRANGIKSDANLEEVELLAAWMRKKLIGN